MSETHSSHARLPHGEPAARSLAHSLTHLLTHCSLAMCRWLCRCRLARLLADRAKDKVTGEIVALKKIRMMKEKSGVAAQHSTHQPQHHNALDESALPREHSFIHRSATDGRSAALLVVLACCSFL